MKVTLNFHLPEIGSVKIKMSSSSGWLYELSVNGSDRSSDSLVQELIRNAIGQRAFIMAIHEAQNSSDGVFNQGPRTLEEIAA